jgi:hypothetical protein
VTVPLCNITDCDKKIIFTDCLLYYVLCFEESISPNPRGLNKQGMVSWNLIGPEIVIAVDDVLVVCFWVSSLCNA